MRKNLSHGFHFFTWIGFLKKKIRDNLCNPWLKSYDQFSPSFDFAHQLDLQDPLTSFREQFIIADFRAPDNIRLGFASLYTSFSEMWEGFNRIKRVMEEKRYEKYPKQKLIVP